MQYSFVCYAGKNRSPVAVEVAEILARKHGIKDFKAKSFGYSVLRDGDYDYISNSDIVFALDQDVVENLARKGFSLENMCNLYIEDIYPLGRYPELRRELEGILNQRLERFFKKKN